MLFCFCFFIFSNFFPIPALDLFQAGVANICNNDISNSNCNQRTSDSNHAEYECTELSHSANATICGCVSSSLATKTAVIIIIDASNHTRDEWQYITLKWLSLYYDTIYQSNNELVHYMLSHGDFTLISFDQNPSSSELSTHSFMQNLASLSKPNVCVAFKRANQWLSKQTNPSKIIYISKTTPFAPSFLYHCRDTKIESDIDIFSIKYYSYLNLNYVQRDIAPFSYEMSIFPHTFEGVLIDANNFKNYSNVIASFIVAAISDFVCMSGDGQETILNTNVINMNMMESDCCVHASGLEYNDLSLINTCDDLHKIREIEYLLATQNCLFYCDPFHFYLETNARNWDCIQNYALWVQLYHICEGNLNLTMWNDYRWHCPMCYNLSIDSYKSVCRSTDGKEQLLNVYILDNCDCRDVTLFLVVVIEFAAILCIVIGMFFLWYRFNVIKVKQHLAQKPLAFVEPPNHREEVILNDVDSQ